MLFSFVAFVKLGPVGPQGGSILTKGTGCSREPPGSFEQPVSFVRVSSALGAQVYNYNVPRHLPSMSLGSLWDLGWS